MTPFPHARLRRYRSTESIRSLIQEHNICANDLILPIFIEEGKNIKTEIKSLPGVYRYSPDEAIKFMKSAAKSGITSFMPFPKVENNLKTEYCEEAWNENSLMAKFILLAKDKIPQVTIIADIALDPYNVYGHDGIFNSNKVLNDETLQCLTKQALLYAKLGVDALAPSDMMDGRVGILRNALEEHNHKETLIISYSAKYASNLYGGFRDAIQSSGKLVGDKKTYQMNPANAKVAMLEVEQDIDEGADAIIVKPGLPYLDIVNRINNKFNIPIFSYHVSSEYSMLKLGHDAGLLNYDQAIVEMAMCFKRAGCSAIISYGALDILDNI